MAGDVQGGAVMARRYRLAECDPQWITWSGRGESETADAIRFDCPEDHENCVHIIPFTPAMDGTPRSRNCAQWTRTGDTFDALTLSPSIRRVPSWPSLEAAVAAGCDPMLVRPALCALHIDIRDGAIEFCGDSR